MPLTSATATSSIALSVQFCSCHQVLASVLLGMPKAKLQLHGEDRVLCRDKVVETWPHGRGKACVLIKHCWMIRAHRGTILRYATEATEATDCQFIKATYKKKVGQSWKKAEEALALDAAPGQDGRPYLRAAVPHGAMKGSRLWARLIVWLWHRPAGMTAKKFNAKTDDDQYRVQANHLNRNPHVTLVDQLEATDPDGNLAHFMQAPALHSRKRPAHSS